MSIANVTAGRARHLLVALVAFAAVALASASVATSPAAAASCKLSTKEQRKGLGPTYTNSLSVSGTSCNNGKRIAKGFYRCRIKNGGAKGTCKKTVAGYKCSERRSNVISTQFDSTVTCRKSRARITFTYTQYT